jgi:glutathione S-transferase
VRGYDRGRVAATLFVIPGSHPSMTARLMLEHKGIEYRRVDLVPAVHRVVLRAAGFPGRTVPALRVDGVRLQGSRTLSRALDALRPEPRLFPRGSERLAPTERAERWGDEVLQPLPRRLVWAALKRDRASIGSFLEEAQLGIPADLAARTSAPIVALLVRLNRASDAAARADLRALPRMLERIDGWIGDGVLGGAERTAADFQVATSIRLLMCLDDLRPVLEDRPAGRLAREVVPAFPGRVGPVFPAEWLNALRP